MKCPKCGSQYVLTATRQLEEFDPGPESFGAGREVEWGTVETYVSVGIRYCVECRWTLPWIEEPRPEGQFSERELEQIRVAKWYEMEGQKAGMPGHTLFITLAKVARIAGL